MPSFRKSPDHSYNYHAVLSGLYIVIANFCSVYNKHAEQEAFLSTNNTDILLGSESHLENIILNSEIFPKSYNII